MELLSASEITTIVWELLFAETQPYKRALYRQSAREALPSIALTGVVLLSQTTLLLFNCSHLSNPPHFVKILGFQGIMAGALIVFFWCMGLMPNSILLFGIFSLVVSLYTYFEASSVLRAAPKYDSYKRINDEYNDAGEPKDGSFIKEKVRKSSYYGLRVGGLVCALAGVLMTIVPYQIIGMVNSVVDQYGFDIIDRSPHMVSLLAVVNVAQASGLFFAVRSSDFQYIWASTEAGFVGLVICSIGYLICLDGYLLFPLAMKYAVCYFWYAIQMYFMWPKRKGSEEDFFYGYSEKLD